MYQLFTAGVTYLNSLWQAHQSGWTIVPALFDAILDIQICTSVMEALAGRFRLVCLLIPDFASCDTRNGYHTQCFRHSVAAYPSPSHFSCWIFFCREFALCRKGER